MSRRQQAHRRKPRYNFMAPLLIVAVIYVVALILALYYLMSRGDIETGSDGKEIVYVSATPEIDENGVPIIPPTLTPDRATDTPIVPTPNPTRDIPQTGSNYVIQSGDTLGTVATLYGVAIEEIQALNPDINPDTLEVGQAIRVPVGNVTYGPDLKLIPDSELVYGPAVSNFSVASFVKFRQGFLKAYSEIIGDVTWSGVELVDYVASNYSVNPRLLLAMLEYRGGWLSNSAPDDYAMSYPMGIASEGREGLYRQLLDAADALNYGYYGWKYRGTISLNFNDGSQLIYASSLNPGTVGVQHMLSLNNSYAQWQHDVSADGFFQTYQRLFGDPFQYAVEPITPPDLTQPELTLPFSRGEEWVYTGGPHGAYNSGSAWGAIDFAPPKPPDELVQAQGSCYISPNWTVAAAPGVIARSGQGYVILDLDGDGNEHTGWTLVYLHVDNSEIIAPGTRVQTGDHLGHQSCEGGFSNGTHLHFSRRYNGEWIPAECESCAPGITVPPLVVGEWTAHGYPNQEYQGYLTRPGDDGYRQAEQTRDYEQNKVSW